MISLTIPQSRRINNFNSIQYCSK